MNRSQIQLEETKNRKSKPKIMANLNELNEVILYYSIFGQIKDDINLLNMIIYCN
jgi:transcriptional regulator of NAD metabolism